MTDTNVLPIPLLETLGLTEAEFRKKARAGKITLRDIAKAILPGHTTIEKVAPAPLPVALTEKQKAALEHLVEVFGSVVPKTARKLNSSEIARLYDERQTLDTILNLAKDRKEKGIRTTILNHIDAEILAANKVAGVKEDSTNLDKDGHVLQETRVPIPETDQEFSWEISSPEPSFDPSVFKDLVASGELDNKDYLAMTEQVRVVDENKVMTLLSKKPHLLNVITKAAVAASPRHGSLFVRNAK